MSEECDGIRIPATCVERFDRGTKLMAESAAKIDTIAESVAKMHVVILGNGTPEKGMAYRLCQIEETCAARTQRSKRITERAWELVAGVVIGVILMMMAGCASAAGDISKQATEVIRRSALVTQAHRDARESIEQAQATKGMPEPSKALLGAATGHIDAAEGHNEAIAVAARKVQSSIPRIEDKAGPLGEFFGDAFVVVKMVIGVIIVIACAILGLWVIRKFGYLLPRATRDEAKLARAVLSDTDPTTAREYVAARRAADPQLNAAMQNTRPPPTA